ncbi:hypothetical protein M8J76_006312 [Diaphorina citri]|nr:hypothetical protein M8J76_006312 [Diaphorina citri]KAI5731221.1 hypothetical protein M8J77_006525 [Diaphorina citri]
MKFLQFAFVFASATLALAQVAPYQVAGVAGTDGEVDPHPKYEFQYSVADPVTGDQKSQQETRDGDKVQGFYTVVESDGSLRRVEYYADAVSGFTATVSHQPGGPAPPAPATYQNYRPEVVAPAPVKVVAPVAPVPAKVVPVPVKVPAQQYYSPARYPGNYYQGYPGYNGYQGYYNQGYYQPSYYQNSGYYQQPAAYYQNSGYYQQPAAYYNNGQQASVTGFFSSPYANYALPGAGNPVGAVSAVSSAPVAASSATKK